MSLVKGSVIVHDGTRVVGVSPSANNDILIYDPDETAGVKYVTGPQTFSTYNINTEVDISSGWTDIPWEVQAKVDPAYTHDSGNAEVTFNESGNYQTKVDIGTYVTSGNSRTESLIRVVKDTGGGYTEVNGTRGSMYNRNSAQGRNSTHINMILPFDSGDKIKVQGQVSSGSNTVLTEGNYCRFFLQKNLT